MDNNYEEDISQRTMRKLIGKDNGWILIDPDNDIAQTFKSKEALIKKAEELHDEGELSKSARAFKVEAEFKLSLALEVVKQ